MKRNFIVLILCLLLAVTTGCLPRQEQDELYQVSTLQALIVGEYDGVITAGELKAHGDTGLGTFDALDGEMIVIDSKVYKAQADGKVSEVKNSETIPFANVAFIDDTEKIKLSFDGGYEGLKAELDKLFEECNMPMVFLIEGEFTGITYRSVPEQEKPYPNLTEVVEHQSVFEDEKIKGAIVGFRFPELMGEMNAVGYHLHFISDNRKKGGHLLDVESGEVKISAEDLESLSVLFPTASATRSLPCPKRMSMRLSKVTNFLNNIEILNLLKKLCI